MSNYRGEIIRLVTAGRFDDLSPEQHEYFKKIQVADDAIRLYGTGKKAKNVICATLGVQAGTALKYMQEAQLIIGSTSAADKKYWQSWAVEHLIQTINGLKEKIFKKDDNDELTGEFVENVSTSYLKLYNDFIKELRDTIGYNDIEEEKESIPVPEIILISGDPKSIGLKDIKLTADQIAEKYGPKLIEKSNRQSDEGDK